jgi:hypothetical protein
MTMKNSGRRQAVRAAAVFLAAALSGPALAATDDTLRVMKDVSTGTAACAQQKPDGCLGFILSLVTGSVGAKSVGQLTYEKLGEMDGKLDAMSNKLTTIQSTLLSISAQISSASIDARVSTLTDVQNNITHGLEKLRLVKSACLHALEHPTDSHAIADCDDKKRTFLEAANSQVIYTERNLHDQLVGNSLGLSPLVPLFYDRYVAQSAFQSGALYRKMRTQLDYYQHLQAMQLVIMAEVYNSDDSAYPPSVNRSVTKPALAAVINEYTRRMKQQDDLLLPPIPYGQLIHTPTGKMWMWQWNRLTYAAASDGAKPYGAVVASMDDLLALLPSVPNLGYNSTLAGALKHAFESAKYGNVSDGLPPTWLETMGDVWTSTGGDNGQLLDMGPYKYRDGVIVKVDRSRGYSHLNPSPYQKKIANLTALGYNTGGQYVTPQRYFQPVPCDAGYEWWSYTGGLCSGVSSGTPAAQAVRLPSTDYATSLYVLQLSPQQVASFLGTR